MTPERYRQIGELYHAALEVDANERVAFLEHACAGDAELRHEVESLIGSHHQAADFIAAPAIAVVAGMLSASEADALTGQTIAHYRVLSLIGAGGMGRVYLAEDIGLGRRVALKLLPEYLTHDKNQVQRLHQEARAASALNHPNIVTIHEIGQTDSAHFIATEFIDGETLRDHMSSTPMTISEVLDITAQIASALQAAREAGIVHRDIKPENVMLRRDGFVKVLDFGLAKLALNQGAAVATEEPAQSMIKTNPGMVMGTVGYMSPEQARGFEVDARTDIWSLGVVLYEMLTGKLPFAGETASDIIANILKTEPAPLAAYAPETPDELQRIARKCLEKKCEGRYQTAKELFVDLRQLQKRLEAGDEIRRSAEPNIGIRTDKTDSMPTAKSMAVLPFKSLGVDGGDEYLGIGIAETLTTRLSSLKQLIVRPTSAVLKYASSEKETVGIGRDLQVDMVLEGSIRRLGERLRVTARLVSVPDGSVAWADKFDENFTDIFAVEDSISGKVAEALALKLSGEEQKRLTKRYTDNAEAYQLYLKGRYFWNKRTEDDFNRGIAQFKQAVQKDSNYALAYAGLADSYIGLTFYNFTAPNETMPKAKEAAMTALAIDNALAEAHASLAHALMNYDWNWSEAEKEFNLSIELNPDYATAHEWYAIHYLTAMGRTDEAVQEMKRALELEPTSLVMNTFLGAALYFAERYDEAIEQCRRTLEMDPNFAVAHWHLGLAYEQKGMFGDAIAEFQTATTLSGGSPLMRASLGHAYAKANRKDEALMILNELKELSKQRYVSSYEVGAIYAALGDNEQALQLLERAYTEHCFHLVYLKVGPQFNVVRADLRFQDLVQRIGLSQ